jgi:hypothetical protein
VPPPEPILIAGRTRILTSPDHVPYRAHNVARTGGTAGTRGIAGIHRITGIAERARGRVTACERKASHARRNGRKGPFSGRKSPRSHLQEDL